MTWSMGTGSARLRAVAARRAHLREERTVKAPVVAELRVERDHQQRSLARGDRMVSNGREPLDARPVLGDPRRADEHRPHGTAVDAGELDVLLEGVQLT